MSNKPVILIPRENDLLVAAHAFHLANLGEFLLPRTLGEFDQLASSGQLWVATQDSRVIASCYVTRADDQDDAEFGGVVALPECRGKGFAWAIGLVAISTHALLDSYKRMIAHVHVDNRDPIKLLTERLGFTTKDPDQAVIRKADLEKKLGHQIAMRADENGDIRGDTYVFDRTQLAKFADTIEQNQAPLDSLTLESPYLTGNAMLEAVAILRNMAR